MSNENNAVPGNDNDDNPDNDEALLFAMLISILEWLLRTPMFDPKHAVITWP